MTTKTQELSPFHLAFPVSDLAAARDFYLNRLGCKMGRSSQHWIDFDFFGHQIVAHLSKPESGDVRCDSNPVDGHNVPVPHFGVVLDWEQWHELSCRLKADGTDFVIEPYIRFEGEAGEQATMFFLDPSGNALEFKAFKNRDDLFRT